MKKSMLAAAILSLWGLTSAQTGKVGWSLGYYPAWDQGSFPPSDINYKAFTHISHFAIVPNNDGSLNIGANGLSDSYCKAAVAAAHAAGVKIVICVGGAGADGFTSACAPGTRAKFISNLIAFMKQYGYDGIDTDWEEQFDDSEFVQWHREMRDSLDLLNPRPSLTEAAEDWYANPTGKVSAYVDQVNDMCYGDNASSTSATNSQISDLNNLIQAGVPKAKLGPGVGLNEGGGSSFSNGTEATAEMNFVMQNGYGGVMEWTVTGTAAVFTAIQPFVPAGGATGIEAADNALVENGGVLRISQNAMTGMQQIEYSVSTPSAALVRLGLYDLRGALVQTLVQGIRGPGSYSIPLGRSNNANLRPGAYVVELSLPSHAPTAQPVVIP